MIHVNVNIIIFIIIIIIIIIITIILCFIWSLVLRCRYLSFDMVSEHPSPLLAVLAEAVTSAENARRGERQLLYRANLANVSVNESIYIYN